MGTADIASKHHEPRRLAMIALAAAWLLGGCSPAGGQGRPAPTAAPSLRAQAASVAAQFALAREACAAAGLPSLVQCAAWDDEDMAAEERAARTARAALARRGAFYDHCKASHPRAACVRMLHAALQPDPAPVAEGGVRAARGP